MTRRRTSSAGAVAAIPAPPTTYVNPVYDREFPDPFVIKYCGQYWAYCTGLWHDGRAFGILQSADLVQWDSVGGAMPPLEGTWSQYWAPAVWHDSGTFFMYYGAGHEDHMEIRVATASRPDGPFKDCGRRLTREEFAIDADLFVDDDGTRYLLYATDFLDRCRVGTGIVIDRLRDPYTLVGDPRPVALPQYEWQLFDPCRREKGGVAWYTVEGPFVLKHKNRYYTMFSGGAWKSGAYAVGYAVADDIGRREEWHQVTDGRQVQPIMRTVPGKVRGPGHNSVVLGPDNRQLFCAYHSWSGQSEAGPSERVLAIDRLDWCGNRLLVLGPTHTPQQAPVQPSASGVIDWSFEGGGWCVSENVLRQGRDTGTARARYDTRARSFLAEVSVRASSKSGGHHFAGILLESELGIGASLGIEAGQGWVLAGWLSAQGWQERRDPLPAMFDVSAYHLMRIELDGLRASLSLEGVSKTWDCHLGAAPSWVNLRTEETEAAFAGFSLTMGWANSFEDQDIEPDDLGWIAGQGGVWRIEGGELCGESPDTVSAIEKELPSESYELVVNARLVAELEAAGSYSFEPAGSRDGDGPLVTLARQNAGWALHCRNSTDVVVLPLPESFQPSTYQQFRFWKRGPELAVHLEGSLLGTLPAPASPTHVGLQVDRAVAAFDMVRVTALPDALP